MFAAHWFSLPFFIALPSRPALSFWPPHIQHISRVQRPCEIAGETAQAYISSLSIYTYAAVYILFRRFSLVWRVGLQPARISDLWCVSPYIEKFCARAPLSLRERFIAFAQLPILQGCHSICTGNKSQATLKRDEKTPEPGNGLGLSHLSMRPDQINKRLWSWGRRPLFAQLFWCGTAQMYVICADIYLHTAAEKQSQAACSKHSNCGSILRLLALFPNWPNLAPNVSTDACGSSRVLIAGGSGLFALSV